MISVSKCRRNTSERLYGPLIIGCFLLSRALGATRRDSLDSARRARKARLCSAVACIIGQRGFTASTCGRDLRFCTLWRYWAAHVCSRCTRVFFLSETHWMCIKFYLKRQHKANDIITLPANQAPIPRIKKKWNKFLKNILGGQMQKVSAFMFLFWFFTLNAPRAAFDWCIQSVIVC